MRIAQLRSEVLRQAPTSIDAPRGSVGILDSRADVIAQIIESIVDVSGAHVRASASQTNTCIPAIEITGLSREGHGEEQYDGAARAAVTTPREQHDQQATQDEEVHGSAAAFAVG